MSLHLTEHNAIFFHIPRLGGRWVGSAMSRAGVTPIITNHSRI